MAGADPEQPWPHTEKSRRMVLDRVSDLTSDPALRARLADELERYAVRFWRDVAGFVP